MDQDALAKLREDLERSRAETRAAFENRALVYAYIYEELVAAIGRDAAIALMKRAIRRRGVEIGLKYRAAANAGDLVGVGHIFCDGSPCEGGLFEPAIEETGEGTIVLRMTACPLVEAWKAAGLPADEIDTLCDIAAAVDVGTFEGAGLDLEFLSRLGAMDQAMCLLKLSVPADE